MELLLVELLRVELLGIELIAGPELGVELIVMELTTGTGVERLGVELAVLELGEGLGEVAAELSLVPAAGTRGDAAGTDVELVTNAAVVVLDVLHNIPGTSVKMVLDSLSVALDIAVNVVVFILGVPKNVLDAPVTIEDVLEGMVQDSRDPVKDVKDASMDASVIPLSRCPPLLFSVLLGLLLLILQVLLCMEFSVSESRGNLQSTLLALGSNEEEEFRTLTREGISGSGMSSMSRTFSLFNRTFSCSFLSS